MNKLPVLLPCCLLAFLCSCGRKEAVCPSPVPLSDPQGAEQEKGRIGLQWQAVDGSRDRTRDWQQRQRDAHVSLEHTIRAYRDSMRTSSGALSSPGGCVDWRASVQGELDHQALVSALLRELADPSATAMEWTVLDSAFDPARLVATYAIASGGVDSATLDLGRRQVRRAAVK